MKLHIVPCLILCLSSQAFADEIISCGDTCRVVNVSSYSATSSGSCNQGSFTCSGYQVDSGGSSTRSYFYYQIWSYQSDASCLENYGKTFCWIQIANSSNRVCTWSAENLYNTYHHDDGWNPNESLPNGCQVPNPCEEKAGTSAGWQLINYTEGSTPVPPNTCVDGCQVEASQINELPCSGSSCAATVQFTYTGQECGAGEDINTDPEQPSACETQWTAKKNECGGAANIGSFDWSTCTGECSEPENSCAAAWANLAERCGDEGLIVNWNSKDCTGQCKDDPKPDVENGDYPPESVKTETTTNSDGSYDVTKTTTYNIDGDTYTTTETTNYASDGTETGSTTTESQGNSGSDSEGEGEEESFGAITTDSFGEGYAPSTEPYDIPTRFNTFLTNVQSSGLFSFSSDFFNSLPSGGSPVFSIDGGDTFGGMHTIDLSETMSGGLAVAKTVLLAVFGFLSIRAIIMKR